MRGFLKVVDNFYVSMTHNEERNRQAKWRLGYGDSWRSLVVPRSVASLDILQPRQLKRLKALKELDVAIYRVTPSSSLRYRVVNCLAHPFY